MYIDDAQLELLLNKKKEKIGYPAYDWIDAFLSGITFIITTVFASFENYKYISENSIKLLCVLFGSIFIIRGIYMFIKSIKHKYNHENLLADIKGIDKTAHRFSIIAVRDTFNDYPKKFLLYYDERWQCDFFFSFKTVDGDNVGKITENLSNELQIETCNIKLDYKDEMIHSKYSVSDKMNKIYEHKLYFANISNFNDLIKNEQFEINGKKFKWMTIEQMEQDKTIQEKNTDIVEFVKTFA